MNVFSHGGDLKIPGGGGLPPGTGYFGLQRQPEAGRYAGVHRFGIVEGHGKRSTLPFSGCGGSGELAAVHYGLPSGCFVFGNGANELIHALPRALNLKQAVIPEPAFSEYRLACLRHGTDVLSIRTEERNSFLPSLCRLEEQAADGSAVFLANPSNPSGGLLDAAALHRGCPEPPRSPLDH